MNRLSLPPKSEALEDTARNLGLVHCKPNAMRVRFLIALARLLRVQVTLHPGSSLIRDDFHYDPKQFRRPK